MISVDIASLEALFVAWEHIENDCKSIEEKLCQEGYYSWDTWTEVEHCAYHELMIKRVEQGEIEREIILRIANNKATKAIVIAVIDKEIDKF